MEDTNKQLVSDITTALSALEPDVARRNNYMNTRDRYIYSTGLWEDLDIEGWFAEYNYLKRVVDIHTAQLMGRPFNVYSYYNKEDISVYENDPEELKLAEMRNKKRKANADSRKKVLEAIDRDNGGDAIYKDGARIGSAYGMTVYKQWWDSKDKKVRRVLIEAPQNMYFGWQDSNFRERDFDAYVYQISQDSAYRTYGSKLAEGEMFATSKEGAPFGTISDNKTSDPLNQLSTATSDKPQETDRPMVTVIDLSGFLPKWGKSGSAIKQVERGKESRIGVMIVGGHVVQQVTNDKFIPKYYLIENRRTPRRAWGESDLPQSALDINKEIVQLEADSLTWSNKNTFKLIQAKGFTPDSIPKKKPRKMQVVAMAPEQSLEEMQVTSQPLQDMRSLIEAKLQSFVRVTNIGRVLFDDPTINANSNQALITTMKPVIDAVEDKQSRWNTAIVEMDTDALYLSAQFVPELKDAVNTDEDWFLCVEWPSVLRREDAAFQSMWINRFNAGTISLETYMEKMGDDYSEELDRIRDEMRDPVSAAILGHQLAAIATQMITPPTPPAPNTKYNIQVKADAATVPGATEEILSSAGVAESPQETQIEGGQEEPGAQPGQITSPEQNQRGTQPISQPGSGATSTSPEGAVAQANQNAGA